MADKKISDFTEATSVADGEWFEIENSGGNSRKVKRSNLGFCRRLTSLSTAFNWSAGVTAETDMWTYSLPAGTLASDGQAVRVRISGQLAAVARSRLTRFYFGSTSSTMGNTSTSTDRVFTAEFVITRTGATAQIGSSLTMVGPNNATTTTPVTHNFAPAETLANAITLKVTGQVAASALANDIVLNQVVVEFLP